MKKALQILPWLCFLGIITMAASTKLRQVTIVNSTLDSSPVGSSSPSTGVFTSITGTTFGASTAVCTNGSDALTTLTCQNGDNLFYLNRPLASNVSVAANSATTIDSFTLSALPTACGTNLCRIHLSYGYYISGGTGGFCYAIDGTNEFGMSSSATTFDNFSTCEASAYTTAKYSSGATPTITVGIVNFGSVTVCTETGTTSPCNTQPASVIIPSGMQIEVVLSN